MAHRHRQCSLSHGPFLYRAEGSSTTGIRVTGRYGTCSRADHSGVMLAVLTTLAHFSVSLAMSLPKSAGEP
jgi:hypothetical protein